MQIRTRAAGGLLAALSIPAPGTVPLLAAAGAPATEASPATAPARGYYLEEEMVRTGADAAETRELSRTWIGDGSFRKEQGTEGKVTLFREDRKVVWVLDPAARTYFEVGRELLDAMSRLSLSVLVPESGSDDPGRWLVKTGATRTVGAWRAYELRMEDRPVPGVRLSVWLSEDVPIDREAQRRYSDSLFGEANPAGRLLAAMREHPGYPVEIRLDLRLGAQRLEVRQRLLKVEPWPVDPARFELPGGYRRVPSPFEVVGPSPAPRVSPPASPPASPPRASPTPSRR